MFNRIFGGSDAEQLRFLETRSIITIVALVIALVASIFSPEALGLIAVVMLFIWGWNVVKNWFGITTLGAIFLPQLRHPVPANAHDMSIVKYYILDLRIRYYLHPNCGISHRQYLSK